MCARRPEDALSLNVTSKLALENTNLRADASRIEWSECTTRIMINSFCLRPVRYPRHVNQRTSRSALETGIRHHSGGAGRHLSLTLSRNTHFRDRSDRIRIVRTLHSPTSLIKFDSVSEDMTNRHGELISRDPLYLVSAANHGLRSNHSTMSTAAIRRSSTSTGTLCRSPRCHTSDGIPPYLPSSIVDPRLSRAPLICFKLKRFQPELTLCQG